MQGCYGDTFDEIVVVRNSYGFCSWFGFMFHKCRSTDNSLLPSTLTRLRFSSLTITSGVFSFADLASACPRLKRLFISGLWRARDIPMTLRINLTQTLSAFPLLERCNLSGSDIESDAGIDLSLLPPNLRHLDVTYASWGPPNPSLTGKIRGSRPGLEFKYDRTGLTV